jgi:hypothetical protein
MFVTWPCICQNERKSLLSEIEPGQPITVEILRNGVKSVLMVQL